MSRYIDADALIKQMKSSPAYNDYEWAMYADGFIEDIENAPSIDIVRCRECRYCKTKRGTFKGEPIIFYRCEENNRDVESDDFCSWGERKSDE